MNVSLTPRLEELVRKKVAGGLYNNASEVVREALRLFLEKDAGAAELPQVPSMEMVRQKLVQEEAALREMGVTSLGLFGSVVRGDATPESDIDLLADFDPERGFSLLDKIGIKHHLEEVLSREVDLVNRKRIHPLMRDQVFAEAERIF